MPLLRGFLFPDDLHYLVDHDIWARQDPDSAITIGLTSLGGHISGEFLDFMPKPIGTAVEQDRACAALEMSKTIRSARSPASGTILEINPAVKAEPTLLNSDPYGRGWLMRIQPSNWEADKRQLITGDAIAEAVERYMSLQLVNEFGMELPPPS